MARHIDAFHGEAVSGCPVSLLTLNALEGRPGRDALIDRITQIVFSGGWNIDIHTNAEAINTRISFRSLLHRMC